MDITIVIVNWNTKNLLRDCLESIYKTVRDITFEIIVVDNASHDGSVAMVVKEFPGVRIIENSENRGFGAANNQAFTVMKGRYALLLNTDTVLTENAAHELFTFMENHDVAAMAGGQLLNRDGSRQNSIANFPTVFTLLMNTSLLEYLFPGKYPSKRYEHKNPLEVESVVGACVLVRKKAMDEVGMFDERYFFFFEETDWACQMRAAGWKVYHVPSAMIYHLQGKSIGRNIRSRVEFYRSRYKFFSKWRGHSYNVAVSIIVFVRLIINWLLTSIGGILTAGMNREIRDKWVVYSRLILWNLKGRPYMP
ncbi:MAG: glycosyltransferase family 2 protein [Thermodesulfobacteriota bacterium]|nr:glycosyltransferase family 2 protein [Thermodesulfobacteriota bacterium]